MLRSELEK